MKLIVGLGNPGRVYANNRHNLGFLGINHFGRTQGIRFDRKQGQARIGIGEIAGIKIVLAKPQTYMNSSGESVSRLVKKFNVSLDELVIIHDDLDLPLGKIRIRKGGSSGGHKGVNSIVNELGSQDFIRIRVGIGRPIAPPGIAELGEADVVAYVLSDFTSEEKEIIAASIPQVSEAILSLLNEGMTAAMNKYN